MDFRRISILLSSAILFALLFAGAINAALINDQVVTGLYSDWFPSVVNLGLGSFENPQESLPVGDDYDYSEFLSRWENWSICDWSFPAGLK